MKQLLNTREAALFLGVSVSTLKKWRVEKKGPPYIKGAGATGHPRYRRSDLIAFLENSTISPSA
jgi:hypothetical protein